MILSSEWVSVLLWLLGLFMGGTAMMVYGRRALAEARSRLELQRTQYETRITDYETRVQQLDRQVASDEAELRSLRERLDEARDATRDKSLELASAQNRISDLDRQLTRLQAEHEEKRAALETVKLSFEQSREQLKTEFQNLANKVLEEKGRLFAQSSTSSLDAMLKPFREQIFAFQQRINQVHDEAVKGNASLGTEIKQVLEVGMRMSAEANNLTLALKGDKKTTGNWGEIQLEKTLELAGLVKGDHYEAQPRFKDGEGQNRQPDFVIKLPDNKHMVIDSKVSLVDYDRAVSAETEGQQAAALQAHVKAVKQHIDDLGRKDYSNLIGMRSPSFVLMFMPIESAYIEALKSNRDLFNYGYQRNVVMVSHTTLMPILKTVANLWMVARSSAQAQELSDRAGEIYNQVAVVAENLKKLGDTLGTVSNHYNRTVTALAGRQGLYGKVNRFNELSAKANKALPDIEPHHGDYHVERLSLVANEPDSKSGPDA